MSKFFGNRLEKIDPFFTRSYMCPPPPEDGKDGEGKDGKDGKDGGGGPDLKAINDRLEKLEKENAELRKSKSKKDDEEDPDLIEKAKREREEKEKSAGNTKAIESALKFSLGAKEWLKTNASLLPKDIEGIFNAAEKENYGSAIEKDSAIKSSVIQSFFSIQANMDLLTPSQKSALEDFLKLTKNGKQEKSQGLYDSIFEPTFEMLKRVKKAEQLAKQEHTPGEGDVAYKDRLMKMSKKHYLGEKADA